MLQKLVLYALVLLQWALVLLGVLLIAIALNTHAMEITRFSSLVPPVEGVDRFTPPIFQRMLTSVVTGAVAIGIGAALFYLRRLYTRQQTK